MDGGRRENQKLRSDGEGLADGSVDDVISNEGGDERQDGSDEERKVTHILRRRRPNGHLLRKLFEPEKVNAEIVAKEEERKKENVEEVAKEVL
tara:strand:+ start:184 stop:462 length:279 start_codon:yes stop_codon:yes gene_type:complete